MTVYKYCAGWHILDTIEDVIPDGIVVERTVRTEQE